MPRALRKGIGSTGCDAEQRGHSHCSASVDPIVTDDFPDAVPVLPAELDLILTYGRELIAALLDADRSEAPIENALQPQALGIAMPTLDRD